VKTRVRDGAIGMERARIVGLDAQAFECWSEN
jgi:hypothetical protein